MKTLSLMDSSGDTVIAFDETDTADTAMLGESLAWSGMADKAAARSEARALFDRMTGKGAAVFAVNRGEGKPDLPVRNFDALEQENVIVPLIVGG